MTITTDYFSYTGLPPKRTDSWTPEIGGYKFVEDENQFLQSFSEGFDPNQDKIIAYTNLAVHKYNKAIRKILGRTDEIFVVGERLMGYMNLTPIIENGEEYIAINVGYTTDWNINSEITGLTGYVLELCAADNPVSLSHTVFFPDMYEENNIQMLEELVELAEHVNAKGSTKQDYSRYMQLKKSVFFMENIYKYDGYILTESEMKLSHPLLFTRVWETLSKESKPIQSELVQEIQSNYPTLISGRLKDNKVIGESEVFADRF